MWHASAAPWPTSLLALRGILEPWADRALDGVGDASLGEWREWTGRAVHVRRRLSDLEARKVGPVIDIRGTDEAERRLARVRHRLPPGYTE